MAKINTNKTKKSQTATKTKKLKPTFVQIEQKPYPATINKRLHQIRFNMDENKVDAVYISYLPNIRYLTNYSGYSCFTCARISCKRKMKCIIRNR